MKNHAFLDKYGPWAVVTGASQGIGRAFALSLAGRGMNLFLASRSAEALAALRAEITSHWQVAVEALPVDLSTREGSSRLFAATASREVGLLVASAGFGTSGPFLEGDLEEELNLIDLNCRAAAEQAHHYGREMVQRRKGGIILLSSLLAFQGVARSANYAASKAYIQSLAEGLHRELKPLGVDVLSAAPGPVESGFGARARMNLRGAAKPEEIPEECLRALGRKVTVRPGRLAKLLESSFIGAPRPLRSAIMARVMEGITRGGG